MGIQNALRSYAAAAESVGLLPAGGHPLENFERLGADLRRGGLPRGRREAQRYVGMCRHMQPCMHNRQSSWKHAAPVNARQLLHIKQRIIEGQLSKSSR